MKSILKINNHKDMSAVNSIAGSKTCKITEIPTSIPLYAINSYQVGLYQKTRRKKAVRCSTETVNTAACETLTTRLSADNGNCSANKSLSSGDTSLLHNIQATV